MAGASIYDPGASGSHQGFGAKGVKGSSHKRPCESPEMKGPSTRRPKEEAEAESSQDEVIFTSFLISFISRWSLNFEN